MSPAEWTPGRKRTFFLSVAVLGAGALLRALAIRNDFWQDEIWSWNFVSQLRSVVEIFTSPPFDNNHPLNTFFIWIIGDRAPWELYRVPSLLMGTAAVAFMGLAAGELGSAESLTASILGSFSYLLIYYSSEARGYAPASFFALGAYLAARRSLAGGRAAWRVAFWATVVLGFLSHASFLFVYAGLLAWHALASGGDATAGSGIRVRGFLLLHGPLAAFLLPYLSWLGSLRNGGGPFFSHITVATDLASYTFGLPGSPVLAAMVGLGVAAVVTREIRILRKGPPGEWMFYMVALLSAAGMLIVRYAIASDRPLYPRYFLVLIPFLLVLVSRGLARLPGRGPWWKASYGAIVIAFVAGNMVRFMDLNVKGRGNYLSAIRHMGSSAGETVTVGSMNDFQVRMTLDFYERYLPPGKRIVISDNARLRTDKPEWFILDYGVHEYDESQPPEPFVLLPGCAMYAYERTFPYAGPSGYCWFLYRRVP